MEINKEKVKENFMKQLQESSFIRKEYDPYIEKKVDETIDRICDLTIEKLFGYDQKNTRVIRERFGVYNNGETQSYSKIALENNISKERTRQIVRKVFQIICWEIKSEIDKEKDLKPLTKEELLSQQILFNPLHSAKIYTIGEVISLKKSDLSKIKGVGHKMQQRIINYIHSLGLNFADEEEKNNSININVGEFERESYRAVRTTKRERLIEEYQELLLKMKELEDEAKKLDIDLKLVEEKLKSRIGEKDNGRTR